MGVIITPFGNRNHLGLIVKALRDMDLPIWEAQFLKLVFWVSGIIQSFNHSIIQSPPCSFPLLPSNTNIWLRIKAKLTQCYTKQSQGWWLLSLSPPFLHNTWKKLHTYIYLQGFSTPSPLSSSVRKMRLVGHIKEGHTFSGTKYKFSSISVSYHGPRLHAIENVCLQD